MIKKVLSIALLFAVLAIIGGSLTGDSTVIQLIFGAGVIAIAVVVMPLLKR